MNIMKTLRLQGSNKDKQSPVRQARRLLMEPLEERQMLAVTAADFDTIRSAYPDLNLSANMGDYNVIEITADQLTDANLRQAITTAGTTASNDLIVVRTTATQNKITLFGTELPINIDAAAKGSVTIVSLGDKPLTIDGNQKSRGFNIGWGAEVTFAGLTITGGQSNEGGGGIRNDGILTMTDCTLTRNSADYGGGIFCTVVAVTTVANCTIIENTGRDGGGICNDGELTVINSLILDNIVTGNGGGIFNFHTGCVTVMDSTVSGNTSSRDGGGIFGYGTVTLTNSTITENSSSGNGGGMFFWNTNVVLADVTVSDNTSDVNGGGLHVDGGGSLQIDNATFRCNTAKNCGGGIATLNAEVTIHNTDFIENQNDHHGGGLYHRFGSLTLEKVNFTDNIVLSDDGAADGGGAWIEDCTANLNSVTFEGNQAKMGGGLRTHNTTLTAYYLIIHDNLAFREGGGLCFTDSTVTIMNSTIYFNSANYGAGVFTVGLSSVALINTTIANNTATWDGGGIYGRGEKVQLTLLNTTIGNNAAGWGSGLYLVDLASAILYNTIIAQNTSANIINDVQLYGNSSISGSHNIIGVSESNPNSLTNGQNSNKVGTRSRPVDAMIGLLTDFGNGIAVLPMLSQSPAIDAGISRAGVPNIDAAGQPRYDVPETINMGSGTLNYVDIGAYEFQGKSASPGMVIANNNEKISDPRGIAIDSNDRVYVADYLNHVVVAYSAAGVELRRIGTWGEGNGQLHHPIDIAVDKNDNIYVVSANNIVQVFDSTGKFLRSFGGYGTVAGKFSGPEGISYDVKTDRIYVADTGNHRVQSFTTSGQLVTTFGNGGVIGTTGTLKRDHNGFDQPTDVAVHPITGNVYVADRINSRLEVYNAQGKYVRTYLAVYHAEALCFDEAGNLFIAGEDAGGQPAKSGRIRVLRDGQELCDSNFFGGFDDLERLTSGIAFRKNGDVIFSDTLQSRLVQTTVIRNTEVSEEFTFKEYVTDIDIENRGTYVIFRWKTAQPSPTFLKYSPDRNSSQFQIYENSVLKTTHEVKIEYLTQNTLLDYQIGYKNSFGTLIRWSATDRINTGVSQGQKLVQRIKTVGLIYMDKKVGSAYEKLSETEAKEMEERFYRIAEFYWQNSGFNLWLDFTVVRVERNVTEATPMWIWDIADTELRSLGFTEADDFDLVLGVGEVFEGNYGGGGATALGRYMPMAHWSSATDFVGIHETNHALDGLYGFFNVIEKYEGCHGIWAIEGGEGHDYSINGQIIGNLFPANYTALGNGFSKRIIVPDMDDDKVPDDTVAGLTKPLPITEKTLGTSPNKKDTDGDGLTDFEEATFFPWRGLNPLLKDTDGDGIPDNEDINPAYPINDRVIKASPKIDGTINLNEGWTLVVDKYGYENLNAVIGDNNENSGTSQTYMSWDDEYLYFAFDVLGWGGVDFYIDGGTDNWYYGTNSYKIHLAAWNDNANVSVMPGIPDVFQQIDNGNDWSEFFDTDPKFTKPYQGRPFSDKDNEGLGFASRLVTESDMIFTKRDLSKWENDVFFGHYIYELAIPWSPNVTKLDGYNGKVLGIDISILGDKLFNTDQYAHIMLVDPDDTILAITTDKQSLDEGLTDGVTFTVTRTGDNSKALELTVTSSDTSELTVPTKVTIPAGKNSITFKGTSIQDYLKDGNQNVTITVSAQGFTSANATMTVVDVPPAELVIETLAVSPTSIYPNLSVDVSYKITNNGKLPTQTNPVTKIYLSPDNQLGNDILLKTIDTASINGNTSLAFTDDITVPDGVIGQHWIIVETTYDNGQTVSKVSQAITVLSPTLAITSDKQSLDEGITDGVTFTVTRTGDNSKSLELTVTSSDTSELTVPEKVIIPAGKDSITFKGTSIQDYVKDGNQQTTITVSANGFASVISTVTVVDVPPAELAIDTIIVTPTSQYPNININVTAKIKNNGNLVTQGGLISKIYISSDNQIGNDTLLKTVNSEKIDSGQTITLSEMITIPANVTGQQWIIIETTYNDQTVSKVSAPITILAPTLTLVADKQNLNEGLTDGVTFTVTRTGDNSKALELTVTSSDTSELTVHEKVTIPAGKNSITFKGSSIKDNIVDGNILVQVTVSAQGFDSVTTSVTVTDIDFEPKPETVTFPETGIISQWTLRKNGEKLEIVGSDHKILWSQEIVHLSELVINVSAVRDDSLTVDFSFGGAFLLEHGIQFNGHLETSDTLHFIGTEGNDNIVFRGDESVFNGLSIFTQNVPNFFLDGKNGTDSAMIRTTESNNTFTVSDNFFVMTGGGYRLELTDFNRIESVAMGYRDKTYVYGENDSLIIMNGQYMERRAADQFYRVWYSEQVIAINMDDMNNAILHTGSRGYDYYTMSEGYGTATNAIGSYYHEFVDFKNVNISVPLVTPSVSLPTATGFTHESDRSVWTQNGFKVTIMGNADVTTRDGTILPQKMAAPFAETPMIETVDSNGILYDDKPTLLPSKAILTVKSEETLYHDDWDGNYVAFLAYEHARQQRKRDKPFGLDDELDDWLADFEKLALLELIK